MVYGVLVIVLLRLFVPSVGKLQQKALKFYQNRESLSNKKASFGFLFDRSAFNLLNFSTNLRVVS